MELNSYGELYVLLMMRLPMSVLAAGFLVWAWRQIVLWRSEPRKIVAGPFVPAAAKSPGFVLGHRLPRTFWISGATLAVVAMVALQTSLWCSRNSRGFTEWVST